MSGEPVRPERVRDWLHDLADFGDDAGYLVALGRDAYLADGAEGRLLRNAGERLLIKVATVVERLPEALKAEYPDVDWSNITRMRNLVAHQYDKVNDDLMFVTLTRDIPALVERLGLASQRSLAHGGHAPPQLRILAVAQPPVVVLAEQAAERGQVAEQRAGGLHVLHQPPQLGERVLDRRPSPFRQTQ